MSSFTTKTKAWGSSLGVVIPAEVIKEQKIKLGSKVTISVLPADNSDILQAFGSLKGKVTKSTDQIMRDIDRGWR